MKVIKFLMFILTILLFTCSKNEGEECIDRQWVYVYSEDTCQCIESRNNCAIKYEITKEQYSCINVYLVQSGGNEWDADICVFIDSSICPTITFSGYIRNGGYDLDWCDYIW